MRLCYKTRSHFLLYHKKNILILYFFHLRYLFFKNKRTFTTQNNQELYKNNKTIK
ncbi:hypothetical protein BC792_11386 [Sphingobacterium allocomposti]|uniref:Uncharacterized protein n=1 Tax=Sphingobacterium allocomposti TaxID=415956 RepID=A0A5S5DFU7_9SPHI|nr:hypothetical protein BC792_11386 [Sphingobacterium composti Yoo et al. 2007 non Ten et al. 2007]